MSSDTSTKETGSVSKNPDRLHFLAFAALIFVMIMAASSLFLISRVGLISSSACAQALYDHGCKTLRASLYPKVGDCSEGREKCRSRGKGRGKGYHSLLVSLVVAVMVVFCVLGEGEALKDGEAS